MKRKRIDRGIAVFLIMGLLCAGCGKAEENAVQEVPAVAVRAARPQIGTLTVTNEFVGTVSPQQQVSIIPLVNGKVDAVYFDLGDEVRAGDVLFHVEDDAARLQLQNAQLNQQSAQASAQRTLGSTQTLNNLSMESNLKSIQYQIDMARQQYDAAAGGVADAQQAQADMDEAIDSINESVQGLQASYNQMKQLAGQAKNNAILYKDGHWEFRQVYKGSAPQPEWWSTVINAPGNVSGSQDGSKDTTVTGNENHVLTGPNNAMGSVDGDGAVDNAVSDGNAGENGKPGVGGSVGETDNADGTGSSGDDDNGQDQSGGADKNAENGGGTVSGNGVSDISQKETYGFFFSALSPVVDPPQDSAQTPGVSLPVGEDGNPIGSYQEAVIRYQEQQGLDRLRAGIEQMGYSAQDLGEGRVDEALQQYASQIASMQSQVATLKSNRASLDNSISQAEASRDSSRRTIDFYEENLRDAQVTYEIQNGEAYRDTQAAMQAQLKTAEVGIESAQLQLENYTVTTPISGKIISKSVEEFGMVQAGYAAYVISSDGAMKVSFSVSEAVRNTLSIGKRVTLERDGSIYEAAVTQIGEAVDAQTGLFIVEALLEGDASNLAGGLTVKVRVDTFRSDRTILLPYDAVYFEGEQAYVFTVQEGLARKVAVETGLYNDDTIEITAGLQVDSMVISSWSAQLEDGVQVRLVGLASDEE